MNILGIETSCDETAAAVVQRGHKILSNVIISSLSEHKKYGGVIPEIASRRQLDFINSVVEKSMKEAGVHLKDIDAVAVTRSPGLIGSLLVGISFARALSFAINEPLVEVDHVKAHLYANFLSFQQNFKGKTKNHFRRPKLPAVGLVASGGHTSLYYMKDFHQFKLLGQTLDDAAGEAFDKVGKLLDLGYPGGPAIDEISAKGKNSHLRFTCAQLADTLDFSFSGIKTAVLYHKRNHQTDADYSVSQIAFSFQESIISVLVKKCIVACQRYKVKTLLIGGGVAANSALRHSLLQETTKNGLKVFFPSRSLCMDNAAMIAGLGYHLVK